MLLLIALDGVAGTAGALSSEALHRLVDLAVDGFYATSTALRGTPLDGAGLRAAARRSTALRHST